MDIWFKFLLVISLTINQCNSFSLSLFGGNSSILGLPLPSVDLTCLTCHGVITTLSGLLNDGTEQEEIFEIAINLCVSLNLFPKDVCEGMVGLAGPELLFVLNNTEYDSSTVCGLLLGGSHCTGSELESWNVTVPDNKPEVQYPIVPLGNGTRKILHISDPHVDSEYVIGSPDECEHPLCCRNWGDAEVEGAEPAGYWGAKGTCDIPIRTLDLLLEAAAAHKPDIVYVSGDLPAHDVWNQTHASNLAAIDSVTQSMLKAFPNTPIVMALGNHESAPVNSFSSLATYYSGFNMTWLYNHLAESWSQWVPESSRKTLKLGGFYSFSPFEGLIVVSMNTNFCNRLNWWLLLQHEDPTGELYWLVSLLTQAEMNGNKVHIIGHIPPGSDDCEEGWSHAFNIILTRFESTITGLFFGHHHRDQWQIMWDVNDNERAVAMSYLPPSVTTSGEKNPSFRLFHVDSDLGSSTWTVLEHENWMMNLTRANSNNDTDFYQSYTASTAYGLKNLSPQSWAEVTLSMATNDTLFNEYLRHYYNYYSEPKELTTCDVDCRKNRLCSLVTGDSSDNVPCETINQLINEELSTTEAASSNKSISMDHSTHNHDHHAHHEHMAADPVAGMVNMTLTTLAPMIAAEKPAMTHEGHTMGGGTTMDMSDMDMDMDMDMSMSMSFHFGVDEVILFDAWTIDSVGGLIGSMVGIFLLALLYESIKYFREFLFRQSVTRMTYPGANKQQVPAQERPVQYMDQVLFPSPLEMFSADHGLQTILHMIQFLVSYLLMLIFMTYNVWLCLAVLVGSGTGYFLFGWRKSVVVDVTEHCH